jgi:hypothetical protein
VEIKEIKDYIEARAGTISEIGQFIFDWTANIDTYVNKTFPVVLFNPPVERERKNVKGVLAYEIIYYVIGTKRTTSGEGVEMTMDEKLTAWTALRDIITDLQTAIFSQTNQLTEWSARRLMILDDVVISRDEDMTNDDDIFISVRFTLGSTGARC